jgi:DNA-binding beta-propeller fold protein YncE
VTAATARAAIFKRLAVTRTSVARGGLAAILIIALALTACQPGARAAEYKAKVDLHASVHETGCPASASCLPRVAVTASLTAARVPGHGSPCETARTSLELNNVSLVSGSGSTGGDEESFPVDDAIDAEVAMSTLPSEIFITGEGQCDDAEYEFLSPYLKIELPSARYATLTPPETPLPDPVPAESAQYLANELEQQALYNSWLGALSCAGGAMPRLRYLHADACHSAATTVVGGALLTGKAPAAAPPTEPDPSFALGRFAHTVLGPAACGRRHEKPGRPATRRAGVAKAEAARRHTPATRLQAACSAFRRLATPWLAYMNEDAWLLQQLPSLLEQYEAARRSESSVGATGRASALWAAIAAYVARGDEVESAVARLEKGLARAIRATALDVSFSHAFAAQALAAFRDGRDLPRAVRGELGSVGLKQLIAILRDVRLTAPPRSLSALLESAAIAPTSLDAYIGARGGAALLEQLLGPRAAPLASACAAVYAEAWDRIQREVHAPPAVTSAYAYVLAHAFFSSVSRPEPSCAIGETQLSLVGAPLEATFPVDPTTVVPSLAASPDGLGNATDVALASDGTLLINDELSGDVKRYTPSGTSLGTIGSEGEDAGQFIQPADITVDPSGRIYVSDYEAHRVLRFAASGAFEATIGSQGEGVGQFEHPAGVAWDRSDEALIVVDAPNGIGQGHGRLEAFDANGKPLWATSGNYGEASYLARPRGLAVGPRGEIAVADSNVEAPRVVLFNPDGTFVGETPSSTGLAQPYGVTFDEDGDLWVADRGAGILELSGLDEVVKHYAIFGPSGTVLAPSSLVFDGSTLFVLDFAGQELVGLPVGDL